MKIIIYINIEINIFKNKIYKLIFLIIILIKKNNFRKYINILN